MGTVDHSRSRRDPPPGDHPRRGTQTQGDPPCSASSTPTASAAPQMAPAVDSNFAILTCTPSGLPSRLPGKRHGRFRGRRPATRRPTRLERPFYRLRRGIECVLADAKQVRHLPGRPKHDPGDSRWLAAASSAARSPPASCHRGVPDHPAAHPLPAGPDRRADPGKAARGKLLESAAIKLSSVVTDLHGVTGRDIMDHLIAGERNPNMLAQLARAAPAARSPSWNKPRRRGVLHPGHAALLAAMLARIDRVNAEMPGYRR